MSRKEILKSLFKIDIQWYFFDKENIDIYSPLISELLTDIAFSLLPKQDKEVLLSLIQQNILETDQELLRDIIIYMDEHYSNLLERYPDKNKLLEKIVNKIYEWIIICKKDISEQVIKNCLQNIQTYNNHFWFFLVKKLYLEKYYKETIFLIDKLLKNYFTEEDILYENIIFYKLYSLQQIDYLDNSTLQQEMFRLSKKLHNYPDTKLIVYLEYFTLSEKVKEFDRIIEISHMRISNYNICDLLNIFELSILCNAKKSQRTIEDLLYMSDIICFKGQEEFDIYNLLIAIRENNQNEILKQIKKLKNNYDFKHIKWFYKKNNQFLYHKIKSLIDEK